MNSLNQLAGKLSIMNIFVRLMNIVIRLLAKQLHPILSTHCCLTLGVLLVVAFAASSRQCVGCYWSAQLV